MDFKYYYNNFLQGLERVDLFNHSSDYNHYF